MHVKKTPLRKCTGCGEMKPKKELVRVVKSPEGRGVPRPDPAASRAAAPYVCHSVGCLRLARKARRLEKAFSCPIPAEVYDRMEEEFEASE